MDGPVLKKDLGTFRFQGWAKAPHKTVCRQTDESPLALSSPYQWRHFMAKLQMFTINLS